MPMNDLNARVYEAEVDHRIEHVRAYLQDFRLGKPSPVMIPLWNLRALQDESRQAGHMDVCELCRRMETEIIALQMHQGHDVDALIAEVSKTAALIKRCAHRASPDSSAAVSDQALPYARGGAA
jgi:hypothetical protein